MLSVPDICIFLDPPNLVTGLPGNTFVLPYTYRYDRQQNVERCYVLELER